MTKESLPGDASDRSTSRFYAVIIAGGRGERFWPLSTSRSPKQLLRLFGGQSLLAQAVERLDGLVPPERRFLITTSEIRDAVLADVPAIPPDQIIGEPYGRDTAAAIALACALVRQRDPAAAFCVLTADHLIRPADRFREDLRLCLESALADDDRLLTIGIPPAYPAEGFGYLETDSDHDDGSFRAVRRFVEKPDQARAESYVAAGNYYWNSGMFVWSVKALAQAFERHQPALYRMMDMIPQQATPDALTEQLATIYADLEKISIDYALMEKAENVWMLPAGFEWHDVGSWSAVSEHFPADQAGNTAVGLNALVDSANNIVVGPDDHLVALLGVNDLTVVNSGRATLVCRRDKIQEIKRVVEALKQSAHYRDFL